MEIGLQKRKPGDRTMNEQALPPSRRENNEDIWGLQRENIPVDDLLGGGERREAGRFPALVAMAMGVLLTLVG